MALSRIWGASPIVGRLILYAFGGIHRDDSIGSFALAIDSSSVVLATDTELSSAHDLACDSTWSDVMYMINLGVFCASLFTPPCSTFSTARTFDGGPPPLRGTSPLDIYGFSNLSVRDKKSVQLGTLLAVRTAEALASHIANDIPFVFEQPAPRPGKPHMTLLPDFAPLLANSDVIQKVICQCRFGARARKSTLLLLFRTRDESGYPVSKEPIDCDHPPTSWTVPWSGRSYTSPHPQLQGRQWAIPTSDFDLSMKTRREPTGDFISRAMAAYPRELNLQLAKWLMASTSTPTSSASTSCTTSPPPAATPAPPSLVACGRWRNSLVAPHLLLQDKKTAFGSSSASLTPASVDPTVAKKVVLRSAAFSSSASAPSTTVQGMRRVATIADRLSPSARRIGATICSAFRHWLHSSPAVLAEIVAEMRNEKSTGLPLHHVEHARLLMASVLKPATTGPCELSGIHVGLLQAWRRQAGDPDDLVEQWLANGAPAGVRLPIADKGVFEPYDDAKDTRAADPEDLVTEPAFTNYAGTDADDEVLKEFDRLLSKGWLRRFSSHSSLVAYLGEEPVLCKI